MGYGPVVRPGYERGLSVNVVVVVVVVVAPGHPHLEWVGHDPVGDLGAWAGHFVVVVGLLVVVAAAGGGLGDPLRDSSVGVQFGLSPDG